MQSPTELTFVANALNGLPIMGCLHGSPAACAGLRYGDIVLSIEGVPTPSWAAFFQASTASSACGSGVRPSGDGHRAVRARVFRQGRHLELTLKLSGLANTPRAVLEGDASALFKLA